MRFLKVIIFVTFYFQAYTQCNDCLVLNENGTFDQIIDIPGGDNDASFSRGMMENWFGTHGTGDHFDPTWNWYGLEGIQDTMAHLCYGSRVTHDHSEGIYTKVNILQDDDLMYCLSLDYSSHCSAEKYGKAHIYLANNLVPGGPNAFMFPRKETHYRWFENSENLDVITLDPETEFTEFGMTEYSKTFKPSQAYSQIWLFTEFLFEDQEFSNCGFLFDNLKLTATTDALTEIVVEDQGNNTYQFSPEFEKTLEGVEYRWLINGREYTEAAPLVKLLDASYEATLKITDSRGACAELEVSSASRQNSTLNRCDYSICLDAGGAPSISYIEVILKNGEELVLDENTPGFGFPYCISASQLCSSGEYELEYLVADLNAWFMTNEFMGQAIIGGDNTMDDGCRASIITVVNSEVRFEQIYMLDQSSRGNDQSRTFDIDNCQELIVDETELENELDNSIELSVYPNPAAEYAIIEFNQELENVSIYLSDNNGNQVFKQERLTTSAGQTHKLEMSNFRSGIYTLRVSDAFSANSVKIVKL